MKALVAYGTRWGSTGEVAEELAAILVRQGCPTDVIDLRDGGNVDLEPYDLVVVGSGIAYGSWSRDSLRFLERNVEALRRKRLAMFACCGDLLFDPGRTRECEERYLKEVAGAHLLRPFTLSLFGGVLDFDRYSFLVKGILSMKNAGRKDMTERGIDTTRPYDFRDWERIRQWGESLLGG